MQCLHVPSSKFAWSWGLKPSILGGQLMQTHLWNVYAIWIYHCVGATETHCSRGKPLPLSRFGQNTRRKIWRQDQNVCLGRLTQTKQLGNMSTDRKDIYLIIAIPKERFSCFYSRSGCIQKQTDICNRLEQIQGKGVDSYQKPRNVGCHKWTYSRVEWQQLRAKVGFLGRQWWPWIPTSCWWIWHYMKYEWSFCFHRTDQLSPEVLRHV